MHFLRFLLSSCLEASEQHNTVWIAANVEMLVMLSVDSGRDVLNISGDVLTGICCTEKRKARERERDYSCVTTKRWMRTDQTEPK